MSYPTAALPRSSARRWAAWLALAALVAAGLALYSSGSTVSFVPMDYLEYWAAGRLNARGENPYDPARLRQLQEEEAGSDVGMAVMMWNPPWTLPIVMPLAQLPIRHGLALWLSLHLALVLLSADLLWRGFGGPDRWRWVGWALAGTFAPVTFLLGSGQITGLCLFGVAGFVAASRAGRPGVAGVAVALTAVKPHLLALFGLALVLDAVRNRATRIAVLIGGGALAAATLAAAAPNPTVVGQYLATVTGPSSADHRGLNDWVHPTVGSHLRAATAPGVFAIQFVPLAVAAAVVVLGWWRSRGSRDWVEATPGLILGSLLAAPYGAWSFDLVLLLVPILATAARLAAADWPRPAVWVAGGWYVAVSAVLYACLVTAGRVPGESYVWVTPAVLVGAIVVGSLAGRLPRR